MKAELEYLLETRYPFMARNEETANQFKNMYQQFGCEIDNGWYSLLNSLCEEIMQVYNKHACQPDIIVDQVKEKFGSLRFYYHFYGRPVQIHAFDAVGGFSSRLYPAGNAVHKEIASIVRKWENESLTVCEKCGAHGVLRTELQWICVLCDDCLRNNHE